MLYNNIETKNNEQKNNEQKASNFIMYNIYKEKIIRKENKDKKNS